MTPRVAVDLSPRALLAAGIRGVLAADAPALVGRTWTLRARALSGAASFAAEALAVPREGPVSIVQVRGPLDQRATEHMCGVSDGYDAIEARFYAALSDVESSVVVVEIDSPGGDAAGLLPAVRRMRAAADRAGKPVFAVADEYATSAGYALLLVADKGRVYCPATGRTASIGTVLVTTNEGPALAKEGVEVEVIRSGERKMKPSGIEPLDDDSRADLQKLVDERAAEFAAWVGERRGMAAEDVLALEGAALSGADAARRGLTDGTKTAHEVIAMATAEAALASVREAMGLSSDATAEMMVSRAKEGSAALTALSDAKAAQAKAEAARIALEEQTAREKAQAEAVQRRAAFAAEVKAACDAASITPPTEAKLLAHYDAHGEASARATFDVVRSAAPIVRTSQPGGKDVPSDVAAVVTPAIAARAKALGVDPQEYAAALAAEVK